MAISNEDVQFLTKWQGQARDMHNATVLIEELRLSEEGAKPLLVARKGRFSLISKEDCCLIRLFKRVLLVLGVYSRNEDVIEPLRDRAVECLRDVYRELEDSKASVSELAKKIAFYEGVFAQIDPDWPRSDNPEELAKNVKEGIERRAQKVAEREEEVKRSFRRVMQKEADVKALYARNKAAVDRLKQQKQGLEADCQGLGERARELEGRVRRLKEEADQNDVEALQGRVQQFAEEHNKLCARLWECHGGTGEGHRLFFRLLGEKLKAKDPETRCTIRQYRSPLHVHFQN